MKYDNLRILTKPLTFEQQQELVGFVNDLIDAHNKREDVVVALTAEIKRSIQDKVDAKLKIKSLESQINILEAQVEDYLVVKDIEFDDDEYHPRKKKQLSNPIRKW